MADNTNPGNQQKPTLSWSQPAVTANTNNKPAATTPAASAPSASKAVASEVSNMGTYIGIFVAGVVIGALLGWGITGSSTGTNNTSTATNTASSTNTTGGVNLTGSTVGASGSSVSLSSSQSAGFAVAITKAPVTQPTWLVVYEDRNGAPGNAIGAGLFFPGSPSGTIQLLRATLPGKSYFVGQSVDNGDKVFSLESDKKVTDNNGTALYTQFTAQ
jgi:hypothetical protein